MGRDLEADPHVVAVVVGRVQAQVDAAPRELEIIQCYEGVGATAQDVDEDLLDIAEALRQLEVAGLDASARQGQDGHLVAVLEAGETEGLAVA